MPKRVRWKFIWIAMISIIIVSHFLSIAINLINDITLENQINDYLDIISDNDGEFPEYSEIKKTKHNFITPETPHSVRYFSVVVDSDGNIVTKNLEHIIQVEDNDELKEAVKGILDKGKQKGYIENFKYKVTREDDKILIVFFDCTNYNNLRQNFAIYSFGIVSLMVILIFIIIVLLSNKIIKPIIENSETQKQFITNAGHELKTPVAIILADTEVLELKNGKNDEWVGNIKKQAKRLDILIKNLLELSKLGENNIEIDFTNFDISKVLNSTVETFDILTKGHKINLNIKENVNFYGNQEYIRELFSILIDNAIKYVTPNGEISITLKGGNQKFSKNIDSRKETTPNDDKKVFKIIDQNKSMKLVKGTKKDQNMKKTNSGIIVEITNDYKETLTKEECNKFFERFYRKDKNRNAKKSGYGIGLSMAKSIVKMHQGNIHADSKDKKIHFIVEF